MDEGILPQTEETLECKPEECYNPDRYQGIISMLRVFVATRRYSIVDRLGFAQSPEAATMSLYEGLRTLKAMKDRVETIIGESTQKQKSTYRCIEVLSLEDTGYCMGIRIKTKINNKEEEVCCIPDTRIPDEKEIKMFFSALHHDREKGLQLARQLASLAFTFPEKKN